MFAAALVLITMSCGSTTTSSRPTPSVAPVALPSPVALPPPSLHPNYPPEDLGDIVALADKGATRQFLGAEGQSLGTCSRGWERIYEPGATPPVQRAADLVKFAIAKQLLTRSCGGFVFGTTNDANCNCYHGENGYLEVDRGPAQEPAPGKMEIIYQVVEDHPSPNDWDITVDAPTE